MQASYQQSRRIDGQQFAISRAEMTTSWRKIFSRDLVARKKTCHDPLGENRDDVRESTQSDQMRDRKAWGVILNRLLLREENVPVQNGKLTGTKEPTRQSGNRNYNQTQNPTDLRTKSSLS